MQIRTIHQDALTSDYNWFLPETALRDALNTVLPDARALLVYRVVPNTADVVIINSDWNNPRNEWHIWLIAQTPERLRVLEEGRHLQEIVDRLRHWLIDTDILIADELTKYSSRSLTVRFDNFNLQFDNGYAERPGPRPSLSANSNIEHLDEKSTFRFWTLEDIEDD